MKATMGVSSQSVIKTFLFKYSDNECFVTECNIFYSDSDNGSFVTECNKDFSIVTANDSNTSIITEAMCFK